MCGRYALGIRAGFVRYQLQQQNIPVDEAPEDDEVRETYNFAPGSYGLVYRLDADETTHQQHAPSSTDGQRQDDVSPDEVDAITNHSKQHKLQAMKWGLVPSWTKRNPDYSSLMKTINCRDDSLLENRGMWTSMKKSKRCVVVAQGFYEWQKKNDGKVKIPHFVKRKDGQLMLFAGLWDRVRYEGAEADLWTYTIITTDNNKQLSFLHDRMPVILEADSEEMWKWLDPKRTEWSNELQSILKPYAKELDCYAVSKDVGKVGNNSPDFIVPVASTANKQNIVNFFNAQKESKKSNDAKKPTQKEENHAQALSPKQENCEKTRGEPGKEPTHQVKTLKRAADESTPFSSPKKAIKMESSPTKPVTSPLGKKARDATSNGPREKVSPSKVGPTNSKKITNFFAKT